MDRRRPLAAAVLSVALAGCGAGTDGAQQDAASPPSATGSPGASSRPGTAPGPAGSPASPTQAGAPASGPELAAAVRRAATGTYRVRTTVTGEDPFTATGRGSLVDGTVAVRVAAGAQGEPAQDMELVRGVVYTTLDGVTSGRQRVAVRLADSSDQLRDTVVPYVAATDLTRVVAALRTASSVRRARGTTVVAQVPGRSATSLLGAAVDGSVPATVPVTITLDELGRPRTVVTRLGTTTRTSEYSGYGSGRRPITAPRSTDLVESPL